MRFFCSSLQFLVFLALKVQHIFPLLAVLLSHPYCDTHHPALATGFFLVCSALGVPLIKAKLSLRQECYQMLNVLADLFHSCFSATLETLD